MRGQDDQQQDTDDVNGLQALILSPTRELAMQVSSFDFTILNSNVLTHELQIHRHLVPFCKELAVGIAPIVGGASNTFTRLAMFLFRALLQACLLRSKNVSLLDSQRLLWRRLAACGSSSLEDTSTFITLNSMTLCLVALFLYSSCLFVYVLSFLSLSDTVLRCLPALHHRVRLRYLVLDEADRMIERGHFKELDKLLARLPRPAKCVSLSQVPSHVV